LENDPYGKFLKILSQKISPPHRLTLSSNVVKFVGRENGEIVRYLPKKNKNSAASETVAAAQIAP